MPKFRIHMDGSGDWGHAYISIVSSTGVTDFAGLWPQNPTDASVVFPGKGTIRGNEPILNPHYDPSLPKINPNPQDTQWRRDPNSFEYYPGDKQRYEKVHSPELKDTPRYDKEYDITEKQYQDLKSHIAKSKADAQYTATWENCTDFVQSNWKILGFQGSFADSIPSSTLDKMGYAGIWSWLWQKGINITTGSLSGAWDLSKIGNPDSDISEGIDGMWIHASPIALDINKSGAIETISLANSKTYFDIDNDNFTEKLQWISPTDGWLAVSNINYS